MALKSISAPNCSSMTPHYIKFTFLSRKSLTSSVTLECEQLIRKMLVIDPAKRYTIEQIKNHKWMQMDGGEPSPVTSPVAEIPKPIGEFNEQALRLMQSLGIDQQRTIEVRAAL